MAHDAALDRDAGQPRDQERRRNRDHDRGADVLRHQQLHHVGGIGAEHHHFAVRHVDDAHDAEGDRQSDRRQHQHRTLAQPEQQRLYAAIEAAQVIDFLDRHLRRRAHACIAFAIAAIGRLGSTIEVRRL
jgi:hypothetical protein